MWGILCKIEEFENFMQGIFITQDCRMYLFKQKFVY